MADSQDFYKAEIIDPGDQASQLAHEICVKSYGNSPAVIIVPHQPGNFRGPVGFVWQRELLREMTHYSTEPKTGEIYDWSLIEAVENDGAGGKPQFLTLLGDLQAFRGLGWEIITMTADDFARSGRFPVVIANQMDAKKITERNFPLYQAVMEGYGAALRQSGLVNITGETAIMKHSITAFCDDGGDDQLILTWGANCVGLTRKDRLIDGSKIKPKMVIIGFWEPGYRCNGGTFHTNIIMERFGKDPRQIMQNPKAREFIKKLTVPSVSYAKTISRLLGWKPDGSAEEPLAEIAGIAHITGGGVWGKLKDILPPGVGAKLNHMPEPAEVLLEAQAMSVGTTFWLSDWKAYSTFHGGCGMLLIVDPNSANKVIEEARRDGIRAQVVGITTESEENIITIRSRFMMKRSLVSNCPE
jgi:phosphoribosylformylglycinamidine cyclo-ligase